MSKALGRLVLVASALLMSANAALATDPEPPKPQRKAHRAHYHQPARLSLPGPILAVRVTRGPTCGAWFARYANYAQASCRDYEGVLTAYDPRDPSGVGLYSFRAYYGLR